MSFSKDVWVSVGIVDLNNVCKLCVGFSKDGWFSVRMDGFQ